MIATWAGAKSSRALAGGLIVCGEECAETQPIAVVRLPDFEGFEMTTSRAASLFGCDDSRRVFSSDSSVAPGDSHLLVTAWQVYAHGSHQAADICLGTGVRANRSRRRQVRTHKRWRLVSPGPEN